MGSGSSSDDTSSHVERLSGLLGKAGTLRDTTKDELGGLCNSRDGIDVGVTGRLDTNEGEDEAEEEGQDGFTDVHVELSGKDSAAHDSAGSQADGPPGEGNAVFQRSLDSKMMSNENVDKIER